MTQYIQRKEKQVNNLAHNGEKHIREQHGDKTQAQAEEAIDPNLKNEKLETYTIKDFAKSVQWKVLLL